MSLNVVIASHYGILIAGDRRVGTTIHLNQIDSQKFRISSYGQFFFDGGKKIHFCKKPHNYVAFAFSGAGAINTNQLLEDLSDYLPNERLRVKDYLEAVVKLYEEKPQNYKYGLDEFAPGSHNNIYAVGYNSSENLPFAYQTDLPFGSKSEPLMENKAGVFISGVGDHVGKSEKHFFDTWIKQLENNRNGCRLTGTPEPRALDFKLSKLQQGGLPFEVMNRSEMIKFSEFVINYCEAEQNRLNEFPFVGGGIDLLYIDRSRGVEVIRYEEFLNISDRPLAKTHYHFLQLQCCITAVNLQLDFVEGNPLGKGHVRFPVDKMFVCPDCGTTHNLENIKNTVEEMVHREVIIENS